MCTPVLLHTAVSVVRFWGGGRERRRRQEKKDREERREGGREGGWIREREKEKERGEEVCKDHEYAVVNHSGCWPPLGKGGNTLPFH